MQGRGVISVPVRLNDDLHILIERHEKTQKPLNGKLPEVPAQHLGYIGLADTEQIGASTCFRRRFFMMPSILNTSCALIRCSSAFGTPMSLNTFRFPVSYPFLLVAFPPLQSVPPPQESLNQINTPARRFPPGLRFLLKSVKDVSSGRVPNGVHGAECVAAIVVDDFNHPPPKPLNVFASRCLPPSGATYSA